MKKVVTLPSEVAQQLAQYLVDNDFKFFDWLEWNHAIIDVNECAKVIQEFYDSLS